jgi:hypothetical protein
VAFIELLGLVGAFFSVYEIIWLFVLSCTTLSEMPMMGMIDPYSAGTLTCVKSLATMFERVVPPYSNDSQ